MSCDWHIWCEECSEQHSFLESNHMEREMWLLIKHADEIAGLAGLYGEGIISLTFGGPSGCGSYGDIDVPWFAKHMGHKLVPIDEYGCKSGQCHERVMCECGHYSPCALPHGHAGEHSRKP